jgi:hypothetical protein
VSKLFRFAVHMNIVWTPFVVKVMLLSDLKNTSLVKYFRESVQIICYLLFICILISLAVVGSKFIFGKFPGIVLALYPIVFHCWVLTNTVVHFLYNCSVLFFSKIMCYYYGTWLQPEDQNIQCTSGCMTSDIQQVCWYVYQLK